MHLFSHYYIVWIIRLDYFRQLLGTYLLRKPLVDLRISRRAVEVVYIDRGAFLISLFW